MVFASFPKIQDVDMIISNRHHICQYIVPENLHKILMPKPQADLCIVTKGQEDLSVCGLVKEGGECSFSGKRKDIKTPPADRTAHGKNPYFFLTTPERLTGGVFCCIYG